MSPGEWRIKFEYDMNNDKKTIWCHPSVISYHIAFLGLNNNFLK